MVREVSLRRCRCRFGIVSHSAKGLASVESKMYIINNAHTDVEHVLDVRCEERVRVY